MRKMLGRAAGTLVLAWSAVLSAAEGLSDLERCRHGKAIERALGSHGYRVVVGGGYEDRRDESVKVQVWENEERDWVITEAFLKRNRTCIVRSGIRLHMLY